MSTYVDIHIIQNIPPSCVNRDDSGSPKTAIYGGARRLRVSSQSWKRATRLYFDEVLNIDNLGIRTKRVLEVLTRRISEKAPELQDSALSAAEKVFKQAKIKLAAPRNKTDAPFESTYLLFLSSSQVDRLADLAIEAINEGTDPDAKAVKKILKEDHAADVALFGRMVADDTDLNVDAACQVAHALSTHAAATEYDFFTAVDDTKQQSEEEDAGAGMMGTVEFSSATVYRYATVNFDMLVSNLGHREAALHALDAFITAFCKSMPTGKQNTFANRTLPEAIVVTIRDDQPVSLVGAFETAIQSNVSSGYLAGSVTALKNHAQDIERNFGLSPVASFVVSLRDSDAVAELGDRVVFSDLVPQVLTHLPASEELA